MKVQIAWPWEIKEDIKEYVCVVIDIWAATSNLCLLLSKNAQRILLVDDSTIHLAIDLYPDALRIGESLRPDISKLFHVSNAIAQIHDTVVSEKTILYMSNNGSRIVRQMLSMGAEVVIGSFMNTSAVIRYIQKSPKKVMLVPSGEITLGLVINGGKSLEDYMFAQYVFQKVLQPDKDIEAPLKKAAEYIRSHYLHDGKNIEPGLKLVCTQDVFDHVPSCTFVSKDFIVCS